MVDRCAHFCSGAKCGVTEIVALVRRSSLEGSYAPSSIAWFWGRVIPSVCVLLLSIVTLLSSFSPSEQRVQHASCSLL
jgi:hypothetical protein